MLQSEKGIILRCIKHSESDLIVHLVNTQGARLNMIAKGALKSRKRFGGGILEPTHFVQVTFSRKSYGEEDSLAILQEAQLLSGFPGLRQDYERLELAFYFLQIIAKVSQEGDPDAKGIFDLLGNSLKALEASQNIAYLKTHFELKLLLQQGVLPEDLNVGAWLRFAVAEHEQLQCSQSEFLFIQTQTQKALQTYLS